MFSLRGNAFVVRKEEVESVAPGRRLHYLPLSPPHVVGMAIIEDRTTTIIDLGVCIGDLPLDSEDSGSYLLVAQGERKTGFRVEGSVETVDCPEDRVLTLPELVASDIVPSCVLLDSRVVPLINISLVQQRIIRNELHIPEPGALSAGALDPWEEPSSLRLLTLGTERFCIQGEGSTVLPRHAAPIIRIPSAQKRASGVVYHDGELVPVLAAAEHLGLDAGTASGLLINGQHGNRYGFLITLDQGVIDPTNSLMLPVPPLVRSSVIREAVLQDSAILPLLRLQGLINASLEASEQTPLADRYTPGSLFKDRFRKEPVELLEVALFGDCHAFPREEATDVIPMTNVQRVPHSPAIVLGLAELDKKLLPVLDLAAIFGKRSAIGPSWSLVRLRNGDFDALIAVEKVFSEKTLNTDSQRQVPIALPYDLVYGCYLEEGAVRLILNVEALTVHFEKTEIRDFMATLSPSAARADKEREAPMKQEPVRGVPGHQEPIVVPEENAQEVLIQHLPGIPSAEPVEIPEAAVSTFRDAPGEESATRREQAGLLTRAELPEETKSTEQEPAEHRQEHVQQTNEAEAAAIEERKQNEEREQAKIQEEMIRLQQEETVKRFAQEEREAAAARRLAEGLIRKNREATIAGREEPVVASAPDARMVPDKAYAQERPSSGRVPSLETPTGSNIRRNSLIAAVVVVVLLLAFFVMNKGTKAPVQKETRESAVVAEKKKVEPTAKPQEAPLVLSIPKSMPTSETKVYVVVKGDTLWGIAERFTGNPLNYPRVARDNSIATPDLIFPGQKIQLIQE